MKEIHPSWLEDSDPPEGMFFRIEERAFGIHAVVLRKPRRFFGSKKIAEQWMLAVPWMGDYGLTNEQIVFFAKNLCLDKYEDIQRREQFDRFLHSDNI